MVYTEILQQKIPGTAGDLMKRAGWLVVVVLMAVSFAVATAAQKKEAEGKGGEKSSLAKKAETEVPAAKKSSSARLPNYYSKLDLSDEQRAQVLEIKSKYDAEIAKLTEKIKQLQTSRDLEFESALDARQRQMLGELRAEAAQKREAKSKVKALEKNEGAGGNGK